MESSAPARRRPSELLDVYRATIGTITPSANVVVERVTLGILRDFPEVSAHFSRTEVVGEKDPFPTGYDLGSMLGAARLLGHIHPDVVCWNGSKAGGIDFALDRDLVRRVAELTGAKSTTSILAIDDVLRDDGVKRFGLVSPYLAQYNHNIAATFAREGYECVAEAHSGLADNFSFSRVPADAISGMLRAVAKARPAAILTFCTNFPAAPLVAEMEDELGIPIYDTTTMAVWKSLKLAGVDTRRGRDWGRIFDR